MSTLHSNLGNMKATEGPERQSTPDAAASSCPECLITPATLLPTLPSQPHAPLACLVCCCSDWLHALPALLLQQLASLVC